jgi:hypothetical protein
MIWSLPSWLTVIYMHPTAGEATAVSLSSKRGVEGAVQMCKETGNICKEMQTAVQTKHELHCMHKLP